MNTFYSCCELIMIIIGVILTLSLLLSTRDVDENGMDSYDRMWGIAGERYSRDGVYIKMVNMISGQIL